MFAQLRNGACLSHWFSALGAKQVCFVEARHHMYGRACTESYVCGYRKALCVVPFVGVSDTLSLFVPALCLRLHVLCEQVVRTVSGGLMLGCAVHRSLCRDAQAERSVHASCIGDCVLRVASFRESTLAVEQKDLQGRRPHRLVCRRCR